MTATINGIEMDMTPRYAPDSLVVMTPGGFRTARVIGYRAYPPGMHPKASPLVSSITALECLTEFGSRWFGCESARINSELRMVVIGTNVRDEVRMKWRVCETA